MAGTTQHENFTGDNTAKVHCSLVPLHLWQMSCLTQLKPKAGPSWSAKTTGNKHCPKQAKRAPADDGLKEKVAKIKQQGSGNTQGDTPEAAGSSEKGTLHYRALKELYFIRQFLSKIYLTFQTQSNRHEVRQKEKTEE